MKISYLGISERNCTKECNTRYAMIEGKVNEIDELIVLFNEKDIECDAYSFREEAEMYIEVSDKDDYNYVKGIYKELKKELKK